MSLTHHSVGKLIEFLHHHMSEHIWVCYDHYRPPAYIITDTHTYRRERATTNKMKWINNRAPVKFQGTSRRQKNKGQIHTQIKQHICGCRPHLPFISLTGVQTHVMCVCQGQLSKENWWGCWVAPFLWSRMAAFTAEMWRGRTVKRCEMEDCECVCMCLCMCQHETPPSSLMQLPVIFAFFFFSFFFWESTSQEIAETSR